MTTRANAASMEEIVKASEKRLRELILEVKNDLIDSIDGVKQEVNELKTKVDSIEHDVAVHHDETVELRTELSTMKQAYSNLERQVTLKDIHDRKPNLLFYGLAETPNENVENKLKNFFMEKLNFSQVRADQILIKTAHRLPKSEYQRKHNPSAPPSIIATFVRMADREEVYQARKILREQTGKFSIQTDLPGMLKKRRAILSRQAADIREKQKLWTRVRFVGTEVVMETKDPNTRPSQWNKYE